MSAILLAYWCFYVKSHFTNISRNRDNGFYISPL